MDEGATAFVRCVENTLRQHLLHPSQLGPAEVLGSVTWPYIRVTSGNNRLDWGPFGKFGNPGAPETTRWSYGPKAAQVGVFAGKAWAGVGAVDRDHPDAPNTLRAYIGPRQILRWSDYIPLKSLGWGINQSSAFALGVKLAEELDQEERFQKQDAEFPGKAERTLLIIWVAMMACGIGYSLIFPPRIECSGGLHLGAWIWPVLIGFVVLGFTGLYCLYLLAINRPENVRTLALDVGKMIALHYRRAPFMWTLSVTLAFAAILNQYRYDLRIHTNGQFTRVHDRLLDTWRTYDWQPCPPDDDRD